MGLHRNSIAPLGQRSHSLGDYAGKSLKQTPLEVGGTRDDNPPPSSLSAFLPRSAEPGDFTVSSEIWMGKQALGLSRSKWAGASVPLVPMHSWRGAWMSAPACREEQLRPTTSSCDPKAEGSGSPSAGTRTEPTSKPQLPFQVLGPACARLQSWH